MTLAVAAAVVAVIVFAVDPARGSVLPPCPFHYLTGLYCPGCGSTRACHALLHGDLRTALAMNPLMVVALPLLAVLTLRPAWAARPWVCWTAFVVLVAFGVLRNIPAWPFSMLAPR